MPKISIIIPVYNLQNYIKETINSILNQTFDDFELIVVDDGSDDNSIKILEKYPQVSLFKLKHIGAGSARNFAINKAKGDYILFLDGDDIFDKNFLYLMYKKITENNSDCVICSSREFSKKIKSKQKLHNNSLYPQGWAWDKLVKKELIEKYDLKFSSFNSSEDFLFSYGVYFLANNIDYLDDCLVFHRIRKNSLSKKRNAENIFLAIKELKELLIKNKIYEKRKDDFKNIALKSLVWHYLDFKNVYKKYLVYKLIKTYEKEFNILDLVDIKYDKYFKIYKMIINSKSYFSFIIKYFLFNIKLSL